jgi:two-component system, chemotaxis family, protein-glutamate methylesterase/glutaminase
MTQVEIIVVGASLGGLKAMGALLADLPEGFSVPLGLVQHRQAESEGRLVGLLQRHTKLRVTEAEDKEAIVGGNVYLAPSDYHLLVESGHFALSTEAPVSYARPSIDVLFESAAESYGNRALGVVLTGANDDGARGVASIRRAGGLVIVQAPETAEARSMPEAALREVPDAHSLSVDAIAAFLAELERTARRVG